MGGGGGGGGGLGGPGGVPLGQSVQADAPASAYLPAGQATQEEEAVAPVVVSE